MTLSDEPLGDRAGVEQNFPNPSSTHDESSFNINNISQGGKLGERCDVTTTITATATGNVEDLVNERAKETCCSSTSIPLYGGGGENLCVSGGGLAIHDMGVEMNHAISPMLKLPRPSLMSSLQLTSASSASLSASSSTSSLPFLGFEGSMLHEYPTVTVTDSITGGKDFSHVAEEKKLFSSRLFSKADGPASPENHFLSTVKRHGYYVAVKTAINEYQRISESKDFKCPICKSFLKEPFMTKCGHSFCFACLCQHLESNQDCPKCQEYLRRDLIYPNFLLNDLLEKQYNNVNNGRDRFSDTENSLSVCLIDNLVSELLKHRDDIAKTGQLVHDNVLLEFLYTTKSKTCESIAFLKKQLEILEGDIAVLKKRIPEGDLLVSHELDHLPWTPATCSSAGFPLAPCVPDASSTLKSRKRPVEELESESESETCINGSSKKIKSGNTILEEVTNITMRRYELHGDFVSKKRKVLAHFDDLKERYFDERPLLGSVASPESYLENFRKVLDSASKYGSLSCVASIKCGDVLNVSSIVSSIEFDRDQEFFATGGVSRCIKIFDYANMFSDFVDVHYPVVEISTTNKLSCLSWNRYLKNTLACSDYEGLISLWDVNTKSLVASLDEHEKRAWSVDFCLSDPLKFASGSDDNKVKIWTMNQQSSVMTLGCKANVCCVQFNPKNGNFLAFGSADHNLHYYDLRNAAKPYGVLKGHKKAISYVRFMNENELFTASTDNTLKLWNVDTLSESLRTFSGHLNERNFVGLSVHDDFIACGSEANTVYLYCKSIRKPILNYKFGHVNPLTGGETTDDLNQFVSSVCWHRKSGHLLAANSQGTIKVLELRKA